MIVITGATGTGKSDVAVRVAERLDGEIISADSRQVYRGMDIGTAKPDADLRARAPHHGLDLIDPDRRYSAGRFARDARGWIAEVRARGRQPIVAGGTGFFIRALVDPLAPEPDLGAERRAELRRFLAEREVGTLKRWLGRLDPERAGDLEDEGGPQRLSRSLEVALLSGRPHSWWLRQPPRLAPVPAEVFCLWWPREQLYGRLDARFDRMLEEGLLEETRALLQRFGPEVPGLRSVGYAELAAYLVGELERAEAIRLAKRNTRRFARRQLTWFRHQLPAGSVRLRADRPADALADEIIAGHGGAAGASTGSAHD